MFIDLVRRSHAQQEDGGFGAQISRLNHLAVCAYFASSSASRRSCYSAHEVSPVACAYRAHSFEDQPPQHSLHCPMPYPGSWYKAELGLRARKIHLQTLSTVLQIA